MERISRLPLRRGTLSPATEPGKGVPLDGNWLTQAVRGPDAQFDLFRALAVAGSDAVMRPHAFY
jgi:hypothetical protein